MRTRPLAASVLLVLTAVALTMPARAQDAGKIVDQYIKAEGGSKALSKLQTMTLEGTFTNAADGKAGTYTFDTKLPNRYYSELVAGDRTLIQAYNGKSAWYRDAAGDIATLVGAEGAQLEAAGLYYNSRLVNAKKNKLAVGFAAHAQVRGRDTLEIEVTTPAGIKRHVFFDAQTHLILKEEATIGGIEQQILYDDYRTVDGVKLPYKIELHRGNEAYDITVTRAVANGTVGERVFDFPKKSQVQLPDLKALFKEIDDNQKAIDKLKENYAGTRSEEETEYDKTGKINKREVKEYTFFYLDVDARKKRWPAAKRSGAKERKRKDPERNSKPRETRGQERSQRRESQGRREGKERRRGRRHRDFLAGLPVRESAPRALPRAGRLGLRL
jgi:hypothetical protein